MKKIIIPILTFLVIVPSFVYAAQVDIEAAKQLALNWFTGRSIETGIFDRLGKITPTHFDIVESFIEREKSEDLLYIFNFEDEGFVIVAADDSSIPILGYSFTGGYSPQNHPPAFDNMLENYKKQIIFAKNNNLPSSEKAELLWKSLETSSERLKKESFHQIEEYSTEVLPLLATTWHQVWPYNELCPADPAGSGGHALAGCRATAMAQIMKYWEHPTQGYGYHSYIPASHPGYGVQSADFGETTYDWVNMPNSTSESNIAVATLLYHCGVAVNMDYGPSSSGPSSSSISALQNHFAYYSSMDHVVRIRQDCSDTEWENLLKNELDNGRPILYRVSGHAFVCDGQASNYFHMNWGWGGFFDGYYYLNDLTPGGRDYTGGSGAIIGIQPDDGSFIRTNTFWDADTIKVRNNITVFDDITLTIAPGTYIEFQGHHKLQVYGTLLAIGTEQDTITFSINDTTGFSNIDIEDGGWCGIRFDNNWYAGVGGAMDDNDSSKVVYCKLEYGKADWDGGWNKNAWGGAIFVSSFSELLISNCNINNNISAHGGGGLCIEQNSNLNLINNIISNNKSIGGPGGGINCGSSSPIIANNTIFSNSSGAKGGGISCINYSNPLLSNNTISNNIASHHGGGIAITTSSPRLTNNTISNNNAYYGGGGIFCGGNPTLINNTIINNTATYSHGKGGGICFERSNATLSNNTISNNSTSGDGGGGGGGIYFGYSSPTLMNTILSGNIGYLWHGNQVYLEENSSDPYFYYCDVQGGISAFYGGGASANYDVSHYQNNIESAPLFVNPSEGAGTDYDGLNADWALRDSSICINAGTLDTTGLGLPEFDLAGNARFYGGRIDIGAYENQCPTLVSVVSPGSGTAAGGTSVTTFALAQSYPNPFNPRATIEYQLPVETKVKLEIYNLLGQKVKVLVNLPQKAGYYTVEWDGGGESNREVAAGIYLYHIQAGKFRQTRRMLLLK